MDCCACEQMQNLVWFSCSRWNRKGHVPQKRILPSGSKHPKKYQVTKAATVQTSIRMVRVVKARTNLRWPSKALEWCLPVWVGGLSRLFFFFLKSVQSPFSDDDHHVSDIKEDGAAYNNKERAERQVSLFLAALSKLQRHHKQVLRKVKINLKRCKKGSFGLSFCFRRFQKKLDQQKSKQNAMEMDFRRRLGLIEEKLGFVHVVQGNA